MFSFKKTSPPRNNKHKTKLYEKTPHHGPMPDGYVHIIQFLQADRKGTTEVYRGCTGTPWRYGIASCQYFGSHEECRGLGSQHIGNGYRSHQGQ